MERIHLIVTGNVQGVLFRSGTKLVAEKLGLVGWVKNRSNDAVEIVAEGSKEALQELVQWSKTGPDYALVENVEISWEKPAGEFSSFEIIRFLTQG